jgi:invasion protein IalB
MRRYLHLGLALGLASALVTLAPGARAELSPHELLSTQSLRAKPSSGPDKSERIDTYEDWQVVCVSINKSKESCEMAQSVIEEKSNMQVLRLVIARDPNTQKRMLLVTVPYDVFLPEGLALQFGETLPSVFPYDFCGEGGCFASMEIDDALLSSFEHGGEQRILVMGLDRKVLPIDFSLKGFDEALKASKL